MIVSSYFKTAIEEESFSEFWAKIEADYMKYKSRVKINFPGKLKGSLDRKSTN